MHGASRAQGAPAPLARERRSSVRDPLADSRADESGDRERKASPQIDRPRFVRDLLAGRAVALGEVIPVELDGLRAPFALGDVGPGADRRSSEVERARAPLDAPT